MFLGVCTVISIYNCIRLFRIFIRFFTYNLRLSIERKMYKSNEILNLNVFLVLKCNRLNILITSSIPLVNKLSLKKKKNTIHKIMNKSEIS